MGGYMEAQMNILTAVLQFSVARLPPPRKLSAGSSITSLFTMIHDRA